MKGCTQTSTGWLCQVRIHGIRHARRFPPGTPKAALQRWLTEQQMSHRHEHYRRHSGLLRDDAVRYLAAVRAMPTYDDRARHINQWVTALGARRRASLTAAEIAAQLQVWRQTLSASSCNHRRTALQHLYSTLDGRSGRNPVRDVPRFPEPRPAPRALAASDIRRVLDALADTASRARLEVLAATGLPAKQLGLLTPADVDLDGAVMRVAGRAKGAGAPGRALPLSPAAVEAFRRLARLQAWGPFSNSSLGKAFRAACARVLQRDDLTPYVLRHSFATAVYAATGDLHTVGQLLLHSSPTLTARYALAAVPARLREAVNQATVHTTVHTPSAHAAKSLKTKGRP
jgi:integrase/recombinase XerC